VTQISNEPDSAVEMSLDDVRDILLGFKEDEIEEILRLHSSSVLDAYIAALTHLLKYIDGDIEKRIAY